MSIATDGNTGIGARPEVGVQSMWVRATAAGVDLAGATVRALGIDAGGLVPDKLLSLASKRTGLTDFGTWEYPEALAIACGSLESEGTLGMTGRLVVREHLVAALESRLRRVALHEKRPSVFEVALNRPIVIVGRSGTSRLHRLLTGRPGITGRPRVERPPWFTAVVPGFEAGLLDGCLWTPSLWRLAPARSYRSWFLTQDPGPAQVVLREELQQLQALDLASRVVVELPEHLGFVESLLDAVPEARVVRVRGAPSRQAFHEATGRPDAREGGDLDALWEILEARVPQGVIEVDEALLVEDPDGAVRSLDVS